MQLCNRVRRFSLVRLDFLPNCIPALTDSNLKLKSARILRSAVFSVPGALAAPSFVF